MTAGTPPRVPIERHTARPYLAAAICTCGFAVGSVLRWGRPGIGDFMGDIGLACAAFTAALSCCWGALAEVGRRRVAWLLFGASSLVAGLGNGVWGWYQLVLGQAPPTPSVADWIFLFFGPLAIAALLVYYGGPGGVRAWLRLFLDGTLIAGGFFTLGWAVALSNDVRDGTGHPLRIALALAYPIFDILLVSVVIALRPRAPRHDDRSLRTVLAGLVVIVFCDAMWTIPGVYLAYRSGELLDAGWFGGYLLIACAPWVTSPLPSTSPHAPHRRTGGRLPRVSRALRTAASGFGLLFPYLAGAICLGGLLVKGLTGDRRMDPVLLVVGGTVLLALVARQAITIAENMALARELATREEHFRSLVQSSSDVIMIITAEAEVGYVSSASFHVFGHHPESLCGSDFLSLVHPDDQAEVGSVFREILSGGAPVGRLECRIRCPESRRQDTGGADDWRYAESTVTRYRDGLILNSRDVSDRVALQAQLAHFAYHDPLTGLPNRALLVDRIEHAMGRRAGTGEPVTVLFLDLDGFKAVNDSAGHAAGDELLVDAAGRLRSSIRVGDTVARFGGDEFAVLLDGGTAPHAAREVADRLLVALARPFRVADRFFHVGASIGVASSAPGVTAAELMRRADLAMYDAKSSGKGRVVVYRGSKRGDALPAPSPRRLTVRPDPETLVSET